MFLSKVRHLPTPSIPFSQQLFSPCRPVEDKVVNMTSSQCPALRFYQPPQRLLQAKIKTEGELVETTSRNDSGKPAALEMGEKGNSRSPLSLLIFTSLRDQTELPCALESSESGFITPASQGPNMKFSCLTAYHPWRETPFSPLATASSNIC